MLRRLIADLLGPERKPANNRVGAAAHTPADFTATLEAWLAHAATLAREDPAAALECYRACAAAHPLSVAARLGVANALADLWRLDECIASYAQAANMAPQNPAILSGLLYFSHFASRVDRRNLFELHQRYGRLMSARVTPHRHAPAADPDKRLRIGYVSAHFSRHSVGYFIEPVIAHHDRSRYEIYCYYTLAASDDTTRRIAGLADVWRHAHDKDDTALAAIIAGDGIDILIDLSGHTSDTRLPVFAERPAPLQMTWIGYPDTTGLAAIDYRITDATADPAPDADEVHTERLMRLPDAFLCYQPPADSPAVRMRPGDRPIVFGSFNTLEKLNEHAIRAWARIFDAVPDARLILKASLYQYKETAEHLLRTLEAHGIRRERVELRRSGVERARHLDMYGDIDIALDPFPYNGTTTTCEALWMGVPVVTLAGEAHMSRVGATLLHCTGLKELVATSIDDYVRVATDLARDAARRDRLRGEMRERLRSSPLLDHSRFVRNLETAMRTAWKTWCTAPPAPQ